VAVIPVPADEKNPGRFGWEALRITEEEIPNYWTNGQNIGVLVGEPSGWRVDVDLDADEAVKIAGRFLPPTLLAVASVARTHTGGTSPPRRSLRTGVCPIGKSRLM